MKPSFKKTKEQRHRLFVGLIYPLWAYHNLILFGAEKYFFLPLAACLVQGKSRQGMGVTEIETCNPLIVWVEWEFKRDENGNSHY